MKKILILGSTGMLGKGVTDALLRNKEQYTVSITSRPDTIFKGGRSMGSQKEPVIIRNDFSKMYDLSDFEQVTAWDATDLDLGKLWKPGPSQPDYVINCIGVIKPYFKENDPHKYKRIYVNSVLPHYLSGYAMSCGVKMIHISTDCVFSGKRGSYTEDDLHDAEDEYGNSKSLGEPQNCMTLRTSIIGEELKEKVSLLEWVKSNKDKEIKGFTDHLWNGVTTHQYGEICKKIMSEDLYENGLFHVFSPRTVDKHELVSLINDNFDVGANVLQSQSGNPVNRALATNKLLNSKLNIPDIADQIKTIASSND
ncbi:NAD-dependent dehydratase [archaeon]|nr:NAD-dependent dehydratase [archaeon]